MRHFFDHVKLNMLSLLIWEPFIKLPVLLKPLKCDVFVCCFIQVITNFIKNQPHGKHILLFPILEVYFQINFASLDLISNFRGKVLKRSSHCRHNLRMQFVWLVIFQGINFVHGIFQLLRNYFTPITFLVSASEICNYYIDFV